MNMKNLTPHEVVLVVGEKKIALPPSGQVARLATKTVIIGHVEVGGTSVPVTRTDYGEVEGLPEPQDETILIVSVLVRQRLPGRMDVASPGGQVRDQQGRVVGATSLEVS